MDTETHREKVMWWQRQRMAWCSCRLRNVKGQWPPPEAGRGSIGFDPEAQREHDTTDTSSSDMSPLELWQNEFPSFFSQPVCDTLLSQTPRELILKVSKISEENTHLDIGPSMVTPSDNRPICCVSLNLFLLYKICQEVLLVYNHKMFELKQTHWSLSWLFCFSYEGIFVLRKAVTAQGSRIDLGFVRAMANTWHI